MYARSEEEEKEEDETDSKANSKFVTEIGVKTNVNYSFGVAFKYTANLLNHPQFVAPKYADMQRELIEYFLTINKNGDLMRNL